MRKLLVIGVFVLFGSTLFGQGITFIEGEKWESVLKMAREQNKYIFMDCYTSWCGPCKALAKDIFPQKEVGDFFNAHFVNVKYDMEKGEGKMLREKYKAYIIGFPTLLLIDSSGEIVHQMAGYQKAEALIAGMQAGLEGKTLPALERKYAAGARDFATIRDYVEALNGAFLRERIPAIVVEFLKTIPVEKLMDKEIWALVGTYITDPYTEAYRFVFEQIEKFQYRLRVNRYDLERQLGSGMANAVKEIIRVTAKTKNADTLKMMSERADVLREMLKQNTVKRFPTYLCKLMINDLRLKGEAEEMFRVITSADELNILNYESDFRSSAYLYITEQVKNKKMLNRILEIMLATQENENQGKSDILRGNYYDVIATVYAKLGQKKKAAVARKNYEQLDEKKREEARKFFQVKEEK